MYDHAESVFCVVLLSSRSFGELCKKVPFKRWLINANRKLSITYQIYNYSNCRPEKRADVDWTQMNRDIDAWSDARSPRIAKTLASVLSSRMFVLGIYDQTTASPFQLAVKILRLICSADPNTAARGWWFVRCGPSHQCSEWALNHVRAL